ncbi:Palmitoyltransferase [Mortierella alpina]|nr:Palmitoyltransferase [Mortierella alpina]
MANYILIPWLFALPSSPYARLPSQDLPIPFDHTVGRLTEDSNGSPSLGSLPIIWTNMNVRALFYLVPFNLSLGMLCWNYYLTMTTDPGSPPLDWNSQSAPTPEQTIVIVVCLCLDGPVLFGVSVLSIYHIWCISSNTTTIESWEKDRVLTMIRRGKIRDVKCPYHQGILANFQEVLGKNPLLWLWPRPMLGDGLRFKVKHDKNDLYDPRSSEDEASSSSSSSSAISKPWFRPFDSGPHQRDELVEMV